MDNDERYISIEQSIIDSCKEIKLMEAGLMPKRTWAELKAKLEKELRRDE